MKLIQFKLDFISETPGYVQIAEQVQALLLTGELEPGDQLPTVRYLASELRVNFNTVARAYRILGEAGLISTQQGRGTFILNRPEEAQPVRLKETVLEREATHFLVRLRQRGYTLQQVEDILNNGLQKWRDGILTEAEEKPKSQGEENENGRKNIGIYTALDSGCPDRAGADDRRVN